MSGYALLAHAWGADVRGWDRVRTAYLEHLPAEVDVDVSDEPPSPPEGWEPFVSTAFAGRVAGKSRADLLAELVGLRDAIVVAAAHGKTTTTAMIAFALAVLEQAGVLSSDAERALACFTGVARRLERRGEANGVEVFDDYGHHPTEVSAALDALRENGRRVLALFQPHLYSRTRHLAREFGRALAAAEAVAVADVYPAREAPVPGVTGKLIVEALAEERPGMPLAWTPRWRSEEHTSELQSHSDLVCRLLLEKKKKRTTKARRSRPRLSP